MCEQSDYPEEVLQNIAVARSFLYIVRSLAGFMGRVVGKTSSRQTHLVGISRG